jgi:2-keto-4-pentenoate hydratase
MNQTLIQSAAKQLLPAWIHTQALAGLDKSHLPQNRADGYRVQQALFQATQDSTCGWKIAATSQAGQKHIGVSGPLAGRLMSSRRLLPGAQVNLQGNLMRVMEAEFAFRMKRDVLRSDATPLSTAEVMDAVAALHLAIEIPNSRYTAFEHVGEASLIADFACAGHVVIGPEVNATWRDLALDAHKVQVFRQGAWVADGIGANVLGDPRWALTWLANELQDHGMHLKQGDIVITGTCVVPVPVSEGDQMLADFGVLGQLAVSFT